MIRCHTFAIATACMAGLLSLGAPAQFGRRPKLPEVDALLDRAVAQLPLETSEEDAGAPDDSTVRAAAWTLLALVGDGHTLRAGPRKDTVESVITWLTAQQGEDGAIGTTLRTQATAAFALAEAGLLSGSKDVLADAGRAIQALQGPLATTLDASHEAETFADSLFAVLNAVQAMATAKHGKLEVDDALLDRAQEWILRIGIPPEDSGVTPATLAAARIWAAIWDQEKPRPEWVATITADKAKGRPRAADEALLVTTLGLYQAGGDPWKDWTKDRYNPLRKWAGRQAKRLEAEEAALTALTLESIYRYSKMYKDKR